MSLRANIRSHRFELIVCVFLIVMTLAVYWQVLGYDFVNYDDDGYITENPSVREGLTKKNFLWAFTSFHIGNWHPLTWISHMLDCELFGLKPGMHHLTNLLFHTVNSLLLFLVLRRMTGSIWRSGFVAALFALHPLHVESVAWIAGRKDVLSTLFWMLTLWAYVRYCERPAAFRYFLILIFFALGLMAKPMLITLPFILLLLDYWPLNRLNLDWADKKNNMQFQTSSIFRLVLEKVPLFAITGLLVVVTFFAADKPGLLTSLDDLSLEARAANALVSYVSYIRKMVWPGDLAVFYPHPGTVPVWQVGGTGLLFICVSIMFIGVFRSRPYLLVGWLWYLGTLVPVIGVVQGGAQAMADRYTYVPLIGLFIMIAWGIPDLLGKWRYRRSVLSLSAGLALSAVMLFTWLQLHHWRDSISLWTNALRTTPNNWIAHNNLGKFLLDEGWRIEQRRHLSKEILIRYGFHSVPVDELIKAPPFQKTLQEAAGHFIEALKINSNYVRAYDNLGIALAYQGKYNEAIIQFRNALHIRPDDETARRNLEHTLKKIRKSPSASDSSPR
ncbi:MAG: tetratricopeptide repeat protein [Desulfobacteraceae bacterium]|nr:tetratricopeptide repeat protein [Desulfobacteraceae bacterium]